MERVVPPGYIPGYYPHPKRSHLYNGTYEDPGLPMCRFGWNRDNHSSYSIWRNNIGSNDICKICLKRAHKGLPGIESPFYEGDDDV